MESAAADTLVLMTYLTAYCMAAIAMYVVLMPRPGDPDCIDDCDSDSDTETEDSDTDAYQSWIQSMALRLRILDVPAVRP